MRQIKCRFCEWHTPAFMTTKKGQRIPGSARLLEHIEEVHPVEFQQFRAAQRRLDATEQHDDAEEED